ncbi:MAG: PIG-L deacetylase family protein [Desulfobacterales bacterium]|nr:PIG-L deacetylase family protein [Desulfobacterales bacterium]
MSNTMDVMVVSAHPDDSEFGMAGTIARWVKENQKVIYVVCTSGDKGTSDRNITPEQLTALREKEQQAAAEALGVYEVLFLRHRDQELEDTPEFRKQIVSLIRTYRPRIVMTSDPYRRYVWHRDHRIIGQVVMDAVFPYARDYLAYPDFIKKGLEPHQVKEIYFWGAEDINYRSDITESFDLKLAALRCHKSQIDQLKVADIEEWLRERCRLMAEGEDFELAEGFHREVLP